MNSVRASIEAGATVGAFDGTRLVGSARYHLMRQWWLGRSMPMAGIAGVKVAPEERGRGIGTAMMARMLRDVADRGYPVSVLYPATAPLYRSFGWEIAGGKYETVVPARSLATLIGPDESAPPGPSTSSAAGPATSPSTPTVRRATPDDGAAIVAVKSLVHDTLRHCGPNTREPWELRDWLADPEHFAYLADDGFLSYRWARQADEVDVEELIAASAATAVAARGYPASVSVSVPIDLADPVLPVNAGRWRLEVADGKGSLKRDDGGTAAAALRLGARGFAALF